MDQKSIMTVRVLKRLKAAVGYHELGMTQQAVSCLERVESLGKIEAFGMVVDILRGEFVKNRENDLSAANALEIVAAMLPKPERRAIRMTLAACYGKTDDHVGGGNRAAVDRRVTASDHFLK